MNKRKIVYGVIYVGLVVMFPALPVSGIKFLVGAGAGIIDGISGEGVDYFVDEGKDKLMENVGQIEGPLWKILNPFE